MPPAEFAAPRRIESDPFLPQLCRVKNTFSRAARVSCRSRPRKLRIVRSAASGRTHSLRCSSFVGTSSEPLASGFAESSFSPLHLLSPLGPFHWARRGPRLANAGLPRISNAAMPEVSQSSRFQRKEFPIVFGGASPRPRKLRIVRSAAGGRTHSLRCSSSPRATHFVGLARGHKAHFTPRRGRWKASRLPRPLKLKPSEAGSI